MVRTAQTVRKPGTLLHLRQSRIRRFLLRQEGLRPVQGLAGEEAELEAEPRSERRRRLEQEPASSGLVSKGGWWIVRSPRPL